MRCWQDRKSGPSSFALRDCARMTQVLYRTRARRDRESLDNILRYEAAVNRSLDSHLDRLESLQPGIGLFKAILSATSACFALNSSSLCVEQAGRMLYRFERFLTGTRCFLRRNGIWNMSFEWNALFSGLIGDGRVLAIELSRFHHCRLHVRPVSK
jgi:hypothetical protein